MVDTAPDGFFTDVDTLEDYHNLTNARHGVYHDKADSAFDQISKKCELTPEQPNQVAKIKFPSF